MGAATGVTAAHVGDLAVDEHRIASLRENYLLSDMQTAFVRGQAYEIAFAADDEERQEADDELRQTLVELGRLQTIVLRGTPADLLSDASLFRDDVDDFVRAVESLVASGSTEETSTTDALQAIDMQFDSLNEQLASLLTRLQTRQDQAIADTAAARRWAALVVIGASMIGVLIVVALLQRTVRSILSGLRGVSDAAAALAAGDLSARVDDGRGDEIGAVGSAFNETADAMQDIVRRLADQGRRDAFGRDLNEALDMADTEAAAYDVIARSLVAVSNDHPMELLLADSSRAHLERRVQHPNAGAPGCTVDSPFACVAVRRGTVTTFSDSRALNACPNLHAASDKPCSAVCIPVTFMGRALGVLHTTAAVGAEPDAEEVSRLTAVATAAGVRIGTVRAFDQTTLQATTDALTGLSNRRRFEQVARNLQRDGTPFALVMADLDHFKLINDTHGHEAGDRALVRFAHQLRHHVRADDLVARYGGEEFVILLRNTTAAHAAAILDEFRARLAVATAAQPPAITASFGVTDSSFARSLAELLGQADAALYRAKATGRNQVAINEVSAAHDEDQGIQTYVDEGLNDADGGLTLLEVGFQSS